METFLSLLLVIVLIILLIVNKGRDNFNIQIGVKRGFSNVITPNQNCNRNINCFPGSYLAIQNYENMCEPKCGGLLREKVKLKGTCLRAL